VNLRVEIDEKRRTLVRAETPARTFWRKLFRVAKPHGRRVAEKKKRISAKPVTRRSTTRGGSTLTSRRRSSRSFWSKPPKRSVQPVTGAGSFCACSSRRRPDPPRQAAGRSGAHARSPSRVGVLAQVVARELRGQRAGVYWRHRIAARPAADRGPDHRFSVVANVGDGNTDSVPRRARERPSHSCRPSPPAARRQVLRHADDSTGTTPGFHRARLG
jgi:hypothetical protein